MAIGSGTKLTNERKIVPHVKQCAKSACARMSASGMSMRAASLCPSTPGNSVRSLLMSMLCVLPARRPPRGARCSGHRRFVALSRCGATLEGAFTMLTMIGLSGSLRQGSFNSSLLRASAELMPQGVELRIATIRGIPLYDGDLEVAEGIPAPVAALKDGIAAADALLLATPEYNNSIPGVMKNAVDWLSRPASDIRRVFGGKPVALIGASPGGFGTILSQNAWLPVLRTLGAQLWSEGRLLVSRAGSAFDADGILTDPKMRDALRSFLAGYAKFVESTRRSRP